MKKSGNTARIVCLVLAALFILSIIIVPLIYLLSR